MKEQLKAVTPFVSSDLVSQEALKRIQRVAHILPFRSPAGFECRLEGGASDVDFEVELPHHQFLKFSPTVSGDPVWRLVQGLWHQCLDPTSSLSRSVQSLVLEFDLGAPPTSVPTPSVFLALNRDAGTDTDCLLEITRQLLDPPLRARLEPHVRRAVALLPKGGAIRYVGAMLSRRLDALRVNVTGLSPEQAVSYLWRLGWRYSRESVASRFSVAANLVDATVLCFDLADTPAPRIGFECFLHKQPQQERRWRRLLEHLQQIECCTTSKADALLRWPGFVDERSVPGSWPQGFRWGDLLLGASAVSAFRRYISHIKLTYKPPGQVSAKAYLGFTHYWIDVELLSDAKSPVRSNDKAPEPALAQARTPGSPEDLDRHLHAVRVYYDEVSPIVLASIGTTYQAGLVESGSGIDPFCANNLYLACRAGIGSGQRVLDAGCGLCGPAIDVAQHVAGVEIDAITLSSVEATLGQKLVEEAGLSRRVRIHTGDYHRLDFPDATFDCVLFLESLGHSYDLKTLFLEIYRVLRPNGRLYVKDVFCKGSTISMQEQNELAEFHALYRYRTWRVEEPVQALAGVGFESIQSHRFSTVSYHEFLRAMIDGRVDQPFLTDFGRSHYRIFSELPLYYAEIRAHRSR